MAEGPVWRLERLEHAVASMFVLTDEADALVGASFDADDRELRRFAARHGASLSTLRQRRNPPSPAAREMTEYLDGQRREFSLSVRLLGTEFQRRVWRALCEIPYGETWNYAQQAAAINHPAAVRAVGRANGQNPVPVVVPCHRVIGSNGSLTGFAGGLPVKRRLLALESAQRSLFADTARPD